jgi:hypothetical protein
MYPSQALARNIRTAVALPESKVKMASLKSMMANDQIRYLMSKMYTIATEAQWIDGNMGKSAIANMFQFHNVEELMTIVNSRNKVKEFSRAACFRVTRDTENTVVPAGLTKLFGADTQRQALDNKRPAMIRIIYQYLNRVSVFGVK